MSDETQPDGQGEAPTEAPTEAKPTRRTFMAMTVAGAAIAGGAAGLSYLVRDRGELDVLEPPEPMSETGEVLAKLLREHLDELVNLPDVTISKWVNQYEKHRKPFAKDKISRKEIQNFLLSTDFFPDADEDRPLRFVAYYDPYITVCYYPLREA